MADRIDVTMVNKGLVESREKAKALIMSGIVYINNQKVLKSGDKYKDGASIEIRGQKLPYVSRGGLKLEKALKVFDCNLDGLTCMDIGASTGGFTDCMLQNNAKKVYAVDVGYGQLAWKLRNDNRVINMERTNIRYIDFELITDEINFISIDVAFISLKLVLPIAYRILNDNCQLVALIKPQFEAGKEEVGKKGVVRDISIHRKVITDIVDFSVKTGFTVENLDFSPIKGPEGNIEFLILLSKNKDGISKVDFDLVDKVTKNAHEINEV